MEKIFVARRFDRDPKLKIKFYAYSETLTSEPFEINGKLACTMFCKKQSTFIGLIRSGWKDCTSEYLIQLKEEEKLRNQKLKKEEKKPKRGRPKTTKRK